MASPPGNRIPVLESPTAGVFVRVPTLTAATTDSARAATVPTSTRCFIDMSYRIACTFSPGRVGIRNVDVASVRAGIPAEDDPDHRNRDGHGAREAQGATLRERARAVERPLLPLHRVHRCDDYRQRPDAAQPITASRVCSRAPRRA